MKDNVCVIKLISSESTGSWIFLGQHFHQFLLLVPLGFILHDVVRILDHLAVRLAIVGRVALGVVAKVGEHGGNLCHVCHHLVWNVSHPLGQSFNVDRLDDLEETNFFLMCCSLSHVLIITYLI